MKKLCCFFLIVALNSLPLLAKTWQVGSGQEVETIHQALVLAQDCDTLLLQPGTYKEGNLQIRKSITIIGNGKAILDGVFQNEIMTIYGQDIEINGCIFRNGGKSNINELAAIKFINSIDVRVINNNIENCFFGIYGAGSVRCTILNNNIKGTPGHEQQTGNAIHCWKCDQILIEGNTTLRHRDGIYFEFVTNSHIARNHSQGNIRYGLHFMFSHNDSYSHNIFQENGAGVAVMYTKNVTMEFNQFKDNWGTSAYGLLLKDISDSKIYHNTFERNTIGIYMEGSNRIHVEFNEFKENGWAAKIQASCVNNVLTNNNFLGNTFDVATNGDLVLNEYHGNFWDKYEGYDLNKDLVGDVPFHPVGLYATLVERIPETGMLYLSFIVTLLDKLEKMIPAISPENLVDNRPRMAKAITKSPS